MEKTRTPGLYKDTLKDGSVRYRAMLSFRDPATGRRKQKEMTFRTEREGKNALAQNRARAAHGDDAYPDKMLLGALLDEWLARKAPPAVAQSSYVAYRNTVEKHIRPRLGGKVVGAITNRQIEQHYNWMRQQDVGLHAIQNTHARLWQVFKYASRQGIITANPMERVERPQAPEHEHVIWDDGEIARVLSVAHHSLYGPIWTLALLTGMRQGELIGLRWCDVDEAGGVLHVRQQYTRAGHTMYAGPPKYGSVRDIAVGPDVFRLLRSQRSRVAEARLRAGDRWEDHDLVFPAHFGQPIYNSSLPRDLQKVIALAQVKPITIHDVRHTHGSWLARRGKQAREIAERLGHKDPSITHNVYLHTVPEEHRRTASDLDTWAALAIDAEAG